LYAEIWGAHDSDASGDVALADECAMAVAPLRSPRVLLLKDGEYRSGRNVQLSRDLTFTRGL